MTRFSVVLPVRNGLPYVTECVESILAQTHDDFELLVLDNHSTDDTVPWLESVRDPRIRISRSDRPLSIEESWARIKDIPKQEFVTMIGHDDRFEPSFLERIDRLIRQSPDASLYQTGSRLIDPSGRTIRPTRPIPTRESAAEYLAARLTFRRDVFGTGYVMRSRDYDGLGGIPPFERLYFADDTLWLSLTVQSWKAADPTDAFAVRLHPQSESAALPRLWPSTLRGLAQFADFLSTFVITDPDTREVYRQHGPSFFLRYHRNTYLNAIIDASQKGERVAPEVAIRIDAALTRIFPDLSGQLRRSATVRLLETINHSPLRSQVGRLWRGYRRIRR